MYQDIIEFCFNEVGTQKFFEKDKDFDELLTQRFESTLQRAAAAELFGRHQLTGDNNRNGRPKDTREGCHPKVMTINQGCGLEF